MTVTYDHTPGAGPTLVFLHYWGGSARTWDALIDVLSTHETLAVDFRGWGRSRHLPGPFTLEQYAADTLEVIAQAGVGDYVLVGHSMGGKVAQLVAATRPAHLRGVVLVAPAPAAPGPEITPQYQAALAHAYDSDETVAEARDHVLTATQLPAPIKTRIVADSRNSAAEARTEWPLHGIAQDVTAATSRIDVPVLVLAGERDRVEPVTTLTANLLPHLADAEFQIVPHTGHLMPLEAPAAIAAAIAAKAWGRPPASAATDRRRAAPAPGRAG